MVVFDLKNQFGLVLVVLLLISLVSAVQATAHIAGSSEIVWHGESGARLSHTFTSDDASTLCTKIVLDTSDIGGTITQGFGAIAPPSGCSISTWDTQILTISCSPGLPAGSMDDLTDVMLEDAEGKPMVDFTGALITTTFTGEDCVLGNIFTKDPDFSRYTAQYEGICGRIVAPEVPEFPSVFLPVTMIIGFLGAVLLIQRTREQ